MSFLCSCPCSCENEEIVESGRAFDDSQNSYPVQVETANGNRWQSSGLQFGDQIPVVPIDSSEQLWYLERDIDSPLWSFHTKSSEGKKLFVTYEDDAESGRVTLKYGDDERSGEKSFLALRQPGVGFILASPTNPQRFLGVKDQFLVMTDANQPKLEREWIISPEGGEALGQTLTTYHQIQRYGQVGMVWVSDDASPDDNVRIAQSSLQEWQISGSVASSTFKVPLHDFYASRTDVSETDVLFESPVGRSNLREFAIESDPSVPPPAVVIHSLSNNRYIGTDGTLLQLQQTKAEAGGWDLLTTRLVFIKAGGTPDIFPPIRVPAPRDQEDK